MTQETILPLEEVEETNSMSLTEIYELLLATGEIILTVPAQEEDRLRKGLASVKAKSNKKLLADGMPVDKSVISYSCTHAKDSKGFVIPGATAILITLGSRSSITVLDLKLPDDSI